MICPSGIAHFGASLASATACAIVFQNQIIARPYLLHLGARPNEQLGTNHAHSELPAQFGWYFGAEYKMDKLCSVSRFLVRQGSKGWFVYDRERKGPALVGTGRAEKLTKEHADQIQRRLTAESERRAPRVGSKTG